MPRPVPETSKPTQSGASRGSKQTSKGLHSQMGSSGLTEGPNVSVKLIVAPLLKKRQHPDAEFSTKIFQEFDEKTKGCWLLGIYFVFDVGIYKCHLGMEIMIIRAKE